MRSRSMVLISPTEFTGRILDSRTRPIYLRVSYNRKVSIKKSNAILSKALISWSVLTT